MAGKNKYRTGLTGFLRYRGNKIVNLERNSFERELQKDPFAAEAAEGFSTVTPEEIKNDLGILQKKLRIRTISKNRFIYYRFAASLAILIGISALLILVQRNKSEKLISENIEIKSLPEIQKAPAIDQAGPSPEKKKNIYQETDKKKKGEVTSDQVKIVSEDYASAKKMENIAANERHDSILPVEHIAEAENLKVEPARSRALAAAGYEKKDISAQITLKGRIISSEDDLPIPGATVTIKGTSIGTTTDIEGFYTIAIPASLNQTLVASFIGMESKEFMPEPDSIQKIIMKASPMALDEVVVVGYGVARGETDKGVDGTLSYIPPQPVNGRKEFNNYIRENLRTPDDAKTGKKEIVVVSFKVLRTGEIDSLRIIRSPGKKFSDEAIRVIKEGPAWKPAESNSTRIDDEVRIRVVFR
jgi:hypothetical protein